MSSRSRAKPDGKWPTRPPWPEQLPWTRASARHKRTGCLGGGCSHLPSADSQAPQGRGAASVFDAVQTLLLDTRVAALVVATDGRDWLQSGLPVDRVDLVMTDGKADARVLELLVPASAEGFWTVRTLLPDRDEALPAWIGSVVDFIQARALAHLEAGGVR